MYMSRFTLLLFTSLLLIPLTTLAAAEKIEKITFPYGDQKRNYYLFVPDSTKAQTNVPLIVLLHGSGRNGLSLVEKWKDLAAKEKIILVGPDARNSQLWTIPGDGPDFLYDLIEWLKSKHPVNARRVYLFGHSAGAVMALNLTMFESQYFAATAFHAGAWRGPQDHRMMEHAKRKAPIAMIVGTNDNFFPLPAVRATRDALKTQGFPVELTEIAGHTHWYYDLAPKINQQAWEFLRKHELSEEPHYECYDFK